MPFGWKSFSKTVLYCYDKIMSPNALNTHHPHNNERKEMLSSFLNPTAIKPHLSAVCLRRNCESPAAFVSQIKVVDTSAFIAQRVCSAWRAAIRWNINIHLMVVIVMMIYLNEFIILWIQVRKRGTTVKIYSGALSYSPFL